MIFRGRRTFDIETLTFFDESRRMESGGCVPVWAARSVASAAKRIIGTLPGLLRHGRADGKRTEIRREGHRGDRNRERPVRQKPNRILFRRQHRARLCLSHGRGDSRNVAGRKAMVIAECEGLRNAPSMRLERLRKSFRLRNRGKGHDR